ncbi:MAG: hypothetical protein J6K20_14240 [Thermoguttaceae bacterium]|nr:hypothetical protein [Thermoguttaceae bacterium]
MHRKKFLAAAFGLSLLCLGSSTACTEQSESYNYSPYGGYTPYCGYTPYGVSSIDSLVASSPKKEPQKCVCWNISMVSHAPGQCPICGGDGYTNGDYGAWEPRSRENECRHCSGTGKCPACGGEGFKYY